MAAWANPSFKNGPYKTTIGRWAKNGCWDPKTGLGFCVPAQEGIPVRARHLGVGKRCVELWNESGVCFSYLRVISWRFGLMNRTF